MSVSEDVRKYFKRKEFFPALTTWTEQMDRRFIEFALLRNLVVEGIDLKDSPSMNYQNTQLELFGKLNISVHTEDEAQTLKFDKGKALTFSGVPTLVEHLAKTSLRETKGERIVGLDELCQENYYNKVLKHRNMGFPSEALIFDAYRFWGWAGGIASLCSSFLPVFEKLVKREILVFPGLDKDLQITVASCNSFLAFLQTQRQDITQQALSLDESDVEFIGRKIKDADLAHPGGGILAPVGSHVLVGEPLFETDDSKILYLNIGADPKTGQSEQPSWTVTTWYVKAGSKLANGTLILRLSAMNIRADESRFKKLFQDVFRHVTEVRKKAELLKDAVEEETKAGGSGFGSDQGETETSGFHAKLGRFSSLDQPPENIVEETSKALNITPEQAKDTLKKIGKAKKKLQGR